MFGAAGSQVGAAGSRPVRGGCDALFDTGVVDCDLAGSHPVDLPLVVKIGVFQVHLVVLAVCSLHHIVVVDCGDVLLSASQTFGWENLLFRANDVDAFFRLVDFVFEQSEEAGVG